MVHDATGRTIRLPSNWFDEGLAMDTSELPTGVYTVTITDLGDWRTERFIKY
jgi:hypothetical protein